MEIAILEPNTLRIKGKHSSFVLNPTGKVSGVSGVLILGKHKQDDTKLEDGTVVLRGPGEYELAGIKITGVRNNIDTVFSLTIDNVSILVGRAETLEKDHAKLTEHAIVILYADTSVNPSFVTSLATNAVLFYGEKGEETITLLAKEGYRKESKYQTTTEKLPQEMEPILLQ